MCISVHLWANAWEEYSETCLQGTPQYPGESVPTRQVSLHSRFFDMGKTDHHSEKTSPHQSVPWRQVLLYIRTCAILNRHSSNIYIENHYIYMHVRRGLENFNTQRLLTDQSGMLMRHLPHHQRFPVASTQTSHQVLVSLLLFSLSFPADTRHVCMFSSRSLIQLQI